MPRNRDVEIRLDWKCLDWLNPLPPGKTRKKVDGVSMRPTLEAGDMVVLQFGSIGDVKVGDIIVFNRPISGGCEDFTIIHRVVGVASDGELITQGDNRLTNPNPDESGGGPYVHQQCLVGRVVFVIPYLERLADLLPYPANYVLAGLILLFVIFSEMTGAGGKKEGSLDGRRPLSQDSFRLVFWCWRESA